MKTRKIKTDHVLVLGTPINNNQKIWSTNHNFCIRNTSDWWLVVGEISNETDTVIDFQTDWSVVSPSFASFCWSECVCVCVFVYACLCVCMCTLWLREGGRRTRPHNIGTTTSQPQPPWCDCWWNGRVVAWQKPLVPRGIRTGLAVAAQPGRRGVRGRHCGWVGVCVCGWLGSWLSSVLWW